MDKSAIHALPPVAEVVRKHGLFTKKSFGQHFIFDLNLTDKIVRHAGDLTDSTVIEIGPGPGALTRSILLADPKKLIVVEKDPRAIPIMEELRQIAGGGMEIINADALEIDEAEYGGNLKIISNLPYNISTPLLFKWLQQFSKFKSLTLMFQKEVAERISAVPRTKDYGKLSVICQWLAETRSEFDVPASAFVPPPKVVSTVMNIFPYETPPFSADMAMMKKICTVFNQRRKMLRRSLRQITDNPELLLQRTGISPEARPEELTVEEFTQLATELSKL